MLRLPKHFAKSLLERLWWYTLHFGSPVTSLETELAPLVIRLEAERVRLLRHLGNENA